MVTEQQEQEQEQEYLSTSFSVNLEKLAALGRSIQILLLHRRCASCWGTLVQEPDQGLSIKTTEHMKQIANHCSITLNFIHPDLPVMEAVFRVLLSKGNKPMTLESIYENLRERWSNPTNPRTPHVDNLYRMLIADTFYGISQVSQA